MNNSSPTGPRMELTVHLETRAHGAIRIRAGPKPAPRPSQQTEIPRLTRLLALAHRWDRLLEDGTFASRTQIARLMGISRARVTQIMDLQYLAPGIQEEILHSQSIISLNVLSEHSIRILTHTYLWEHQRMRWEALRS